MKIYLLIKPLDYSFADVEVFKTLKEAQYALTRAKEDEETNYEYFSIRKEDI